MIYPRLIPTPLIVMCYYLYMSKTTYYCKYCCDRLGETPKTFCREHAKLLRSWIDNKMYGAMMWLARDEDLTMVLAEMRIFAKIEKP